MEFYIQDLWAKPKLMSQTNTDQVMLLCPDGRQFRKICATAELTPWKKMCTALDALWGRLKRIMYFIVFKNELICFFFCNKIIFPIYISIRVLGLLPYYHSRSQSPSYTNSYFFVLYFIMFILLPNAASYASIPNAFSTYKKIDYLLIVICCTIIFKCKL